MGRHLSHHDALCSFLLYYQPQVGFSIPILSLSENDHNHIQAPAVNTILPKMHINMKARAIIFGPFELGGLGQPHFYPHHEIAKLYLFLGHVRLLDKTGKLIMISLTLLQLANLNEIILDFLYYIIYNTFFYHLVYTYGLYQKHCMYKESRDLSQSPIEEILDPYKNLM
jgi:hypothetical protein